MDKFYNYIRENLYVFSDIEKTYNNNELYKLLYNNEIIYDNDIIINKIKDIVDDEIKLKQINLYLLTFIIHNHIIANNKLIITLLYEEKNYIHDIIKTFNIPFIINNSNFIKFNEINSFEILSKLMDPLILNNIDIFHNVELYESYLNFIRINKNIIPVIKFLKDKNLNGIIPTKANPSDVGYDLTIINLKKKLGEHTYLYDTGIKVFPPLGYYTQIVARSSISKTGYFLSNNLGIIDPSYQGNLLIALTKYDFTKPDLTLPCKIAQLIITQNNHTISMEIDENIYDTSRGEGGFGSTNNN